MRASEVIKLAESWIGLNEKDGSFKKIVDIYNTIKPLPRSYKVKYTDHWCAATMSALFWKLGSDLIPYECSCQKMIELMKLKNIWIESDYITPKAGDIIFYDWDDNGKGDNKGHSDHVGIVQKVFGNTIYVIEGNNNEAVKVRLISVDARYIRGYGRPKYEPEEATEKVEVKVDYAAKMDKALAGTYEITSDLHLRVGAGITKKSIRVMKKGDQVKCYGYFTEVLGTKWYLVSHNGQTGFCSSKYLKRV